MKRLPAGVRARVVLRSFAVQGSWNYETLIGTGFAYTLLPALRYLHGNDGNRLKETIARHSELFNCHPYLATVAVGAVAKLEADGIEPVVIQRFKNALRGSLGTLGDRLIWSTWRPMAALAAVALFLAGAAWWVAVTAFLVIYNVMHFAVRILGLRLGSRTGLEVGRALRETPVQRIIDVASCVACGLAAAAAVLILGGSTQDRFEIVVALAALALGLLLGTYTRRAIAAVLVAITILSSLLGLAGYGA